MRNEEDGEVAFLLEPGQKAQETHPNRDVEHGSGLVGHQDIRIHGESAGDGHALALPPESS